MKWVTRERPKIDRIACPWLIQRFIDKDAEILYVPAADVLRTAKEQAATPFDVPGVDLTHDGPLCSFDTILRKYDLRDPALSRLASIVRAADTDTLDRSPQAPGLLAITLGLGANIRDDQALLQAGLVIYDALFTWCQTLTEERHGWYPEKMQQEVRS
jgi:hypothetical protein